ncbi:MAG: aspartate carbamoyltransferase [Methylovulum sp.]|nr:aspartate carbamoyltransferase [Methylovulum sp.]
MQRSCQQQTPFDRETTLQTFVKTVHGGVQHIVVKSDVLKPADRAREIKLIQAYLQERADEFNKGDFSVTERIHGADMPGLAQLKRAKPDDIRFDYKPLENGAQIHYSTEYPMFVQALHAWFDAQMTEHHNDVIPDHSQHHLTPAD